MRSYVTVTLSDVTVYYTWYFKHSNLCGLRKWLKCSFVVASEYYFGAAPLPIFFMFISFIIASEYYFWWASLPSLFIFSSFIVASEYYYIG